MINNVNTSATTPWSMVGRQSNGRQQSPHIPQGFGRIGANLSATMPGITEREEEILNQIRDKVGGSVKFNLGDYTNDAGQTLTVLGFTGFGASGERSPFMITHDMLREMATDENVYRERMAWVQEMLTQQNFMERSLAENRMRAAQEDAERRGNAVRANIMSVADSFWLDNQNDGSSTTQAIQNQTTGQVAGRYEQMLSGQ